MFSTFGLKKGEEEINIMFTFIVTLRSDNLKFKLPAALENFNRFGNNLLQKFTNLP